MKPDFLSRKISGAEQDVERLKPWHRLDFTYSLEQEFLRQGGETWLRITRNWMLETLGLGIVMVWGAALSGPMPRVLRCCFKREPACQSY